MALTNAQYDAIMRDYNYIQAKNRQQSQARADQLYKLHPDIAQLEQRIVDLSADSGAAIIRGELTLSQYNDKLNALLAERDSLLTGYGYPKDYLAGVYDCSLCKDTGYVDNKKCQCFNKKAIDMLYSQSNVKNILAHENFDTFDLSYYSDSPDAVNPATGTTSYENMRNIYAKAKSFVDNFDNCSDNLLFYGGTGVGKTFLSNCIADALLKSVHSVIYLTAIELFDIFSSSDFRVSDNDKELPDSHYVLDCDLLIIDDLGTELQNQFTNSRLFYCLNERILRGRSTLISTNLSFANFRDQYGERIFSRIMSNYKLLYFFGDDIRIKKKQRRLQG